MLSDSGPTFLHSAPAAEITARVVRASYIPALSSRGCFHTEVRTSKKELALYCEDISPSSSNDQGDLLGPNALRPTAHGDHCLALLRCPQTAALQRTRYEQVCRDVEGKSRGSHSRTKPLSTSRTFDATNPSKPRPTWTYIDPGLLERHDLAITRHGRLALTTRTVRVARLVPNKVRTVFGTEPNNAIYMYMYSSRSAVAVWRATCTHLALALPLPLPLLSCMTLNVCSAVPLFVFCIPFPAV